MPVSMIECITTRITNIRMGRLRTCVVYTMMILMWINIVSSSSSIPEFLSNIKKDQTDMVVLLDRSTGVGRDDFYGIEKPLVEEILRYHVPIKSDAVRIALLVFSIETFTIVDGISDDNNTITKCELFNENSGYWNEAMYKVNYTRVGDSYKRDFSHSDGTFIHTAFDEAARILNKGKKSRPNVKRVVLIATDAAWNENDPADPRDYLLDSLGADIYAIGIGSWVKGRIANLYHLNRPSNQGATQLAEVWRSNLTNTRTLLEDNGEDFDENQCDVSTGYTGRLAGSCSNNPCNGHGTCKSDSAGFSLLCICQKGYDGRECENDINECNYPEICYPTARCKDRLGFAECICQSCAKDRFCEESCSPTKAPQQEDVSGVLVVKFPDWAIIVIPVVVMVIIIILASSFACYRIRKNKKEMIKKNQDSLQGAINPAFTEMEGGGEEGVTLHTRNTWAEPSYPPPPALVAVVQPHHTPSRPAPMAPPTSWTSTPKPDLIIEAQPNANRVPLIPNGFRLPPLKPKENNVETPVLVPPAPAVPPKSKTPNVYQNPINPIVFPTLKPISDRRTDENHSDSIQIPVHRPIQLPVRKPRPQVPVKPAKPPVKEKPKVIPDGQIYRNVSNLANELTSPDNDPIYDVPPDDEQFSYENQWMSDDANIQNIEVPAPFADNVLNHQETHEIISHNNEMNPTTDDAFHSEYGYLWGDKWTNSTMTSIPSAPSHRPDILLGELSRKARPIGTNYDTAPLMKGMPGWLDYVSDLTCDQTSDEVPGLERVCIVRFDTKEFISSDRSILPDDIVQVAEIAKILHFNLTGDKAVFHLRNGKSQRTYSVTKNNGSMLKAYGGKQGQMNEVLSVGKSKKYLVLGGMSLEKDKGQCYIEVEYVLQHLLSTE